MKGTVCKNSTLCAYFTFLFTRKQANLLGKNAATKSAFNTTTWLHFFAYHFEFDSFHKSLRFLACSTTENKKKTNMVA